MGTPLTFPPLVKRLIKGSEVLFSEGDGNLTNIQAFCTALANLIAASLNPDGTLLANSVNAAAIQAAAVQLSNLNPALLYNIVPVDTDIGTIQGSYVITARGGLGGTNLVPGGAIYDANGNYTLNGLVSNYGYYWTKGGNDISCIVPNAQTLTVSQAFQSQETSVVLTGVAGDAITATLTQVAPVNAYKNGMMFFVYTNTSNAGAATLNVNNIGAIPIELYGSGLTSNMIQAPGIFAVVYMNGVFVLFSGGGAAAGTSGSTVITTTGYSGASQFSVPTIALVSSGTPASYVIAHGLGAEPTSFSASLLCVISDSTPGFTAGQTVPLTEFKNSAGTSVTAFSWSADANNIYLTQLINAPYIINPSTGTLQPITNSNWVLQATASLVSNFSGVAAFPAVSYQIANVKGAFSYSHYIYTFSESSASNSGMFYINQINVLNNEITPISQQSSATNLDMINGAMFGTGFFTSPTFAFCSQGGIYTLQASNPNTSYISSGTAYSSSGTANTLALGAGTFVWSPGPNDIQLAVTGGGGGTFLASSAVNGQITFTLSGAASGILTGAPGTVITGTLTSTSSAWIASVFSTYLASGEYKPVWYDSSGTLSSGAVAFYCVSSDFNTNFISAISCYQVTSTYARINATWATNNRANLDLTDVNIVGNPAGFNKWYPAGSQAKVIMFQYNPILKRIYVITNEIAAVSIFQLGGTTNDFSAFWDTSALGNARALLLTYVKSVAIGGTGGPLAELRRCHFTIEYDQNTGKEKCITQTFDGTNPGSYAGSVVRIPWNE